MTSQHHQLLDSIGTPGIRTGVAALLARADAALADVHRLDDDRFDELLDAPPATLAGLWDEAFRGLSALVMLCQALAGSQHSAAVTDDFGDELDFGDIAVARTQTDNELDGALDVGALVDRLDGLPQSDAALWPQVLERVSAIAYGLGSQHAEAQQRMRVALGAGQASQILGLLDDTRSAASDGIHAIVKTAYEAFQPGVDVSTVLPGHLTALGRALLVRRGIADLAADLERDHQVLQTAADDQGEHALTAIRNTLRAFVRSAACRAMRPAERVQMIELDRELHAQRLGAARATSEGLAKYLDSFAAMNERELLVEHDRLAVGEIREAIASARQLVDLSPRTAAEMLARAHDVARRLRGKHRLLDQQIIALDRHAPAPTQSDQTAGFLDRLEQLLFSVGS